VKLITRIHLVPRSTMVEPYFHSRKPLWHSA
jgi:hypothetical protein